MNPHFNSHREEQAIAHTEDMNEQYFDEIQKSINGSWYYRGEVEFDKPTRFDEVTTEIIVEPLTTTEAIIKYASGNRAALNFASYKYPGGGFIKGSIAQEEALCHDSFLYNVLSAKVFAPLYEWNRKTIHQFNGLYSNFGIYSPNIVFEKYTQDIVFEKYPPFGTTKNEVKCDVITVAAPNLSAYHKGEDAEYISTMHKRIKFVLDIAKKHNIDTLILGAFGCGVFKNDPTFVSTVFKELLNSGNYNFKKVIFAVPAGPNYNAFEKTFK